jgi:hypothetical protein
MPLTVRRQCVLPKIQIAFAIIVFSKKTTVQFDMIYLLTAMGCHLVAVVHIYTQTIHRKIQNKQYIEQHNNWSVRAVPRLG